MEVKEDLSLHIHHHFSWSQRGWGRGGVGMVSDSIMSNSSIRFTLYSPIKEFTALKDPVGEFVLYVCHPISHTPNISVSPLRCLALGDILASAAPALSKAAAETAEQQRASGQTPSGHNGGEEVKELSPLSSRI